MKRPIISLEKGALTIEFNAPSSVIREYITANKIKFVMDILVTEKFDFTPNYREYADIISGVFMAVPSGIIRVEGISFYTGKTVLNQDFMPGKCTGIKCLIDTGKYIIPRL